jgi:hypothetical protein
MDKLEPKKEVSEFGEFGETSLDDLDELRELAEALESRRQRIALVFDCTSSMGPYWEVATKTLNRVIDGIKNQSTVPIQIKVVGYRDVRCDNYPIEACEWSDNTGYLKEFVGSVYCTGGGDFPESIGDGLKEVIHEGPSQIILIGDAPGHKGSEGYTEAHECRLAGCPIYALYTARHPDTVEAFEKIAKLSGGKAFYLSSTSAECFEDIITVLLASNKALAIEYQPKTLEGKAVKALLT